eukprot:7354-Heterococcus_DN1.PRE.3
MTPKRCSHTLQLDLQLQQQAPRLLQRILHQHCPLIRLHESTLAQTMAGASNGKYYNKLSFRNSSSSSKAKRSVGCGRETSGSC